MAGAGLRQLDGEASASSGRLVGLGGLRIHTGNHGVAIRLAFTPDAQGKGYGAELGRAALTFAFVDVARLERVAAITRLEKRPGSALAGKVRHGTRARDQDR